MHINRNFCTYAGKERLCEPERRKSEKERTHNFHEILLTGVPSPEMSDCVLLGSWMEIVEGRTE